MREKLDADRIIATVAQLQRRIEERFPDSGLGRVCAALLEVAQDTRERCAWIERPLIGLRIAIGLFVAAVVLTLIGALASSGLKVRSLELFELLQVLEAAINDAILIGAAIFFLVTIETRIKRRRALAAIDELRALSHVIDMHQLTKDPELTADGADRTRSSPKRDLTPFQLSRYLDYCSEMLSLIGKIAALYAQHSSDPVALGAVNEIENLTTGLSRKIWQKMMTFDR